MLGEICLERLSEIAFTKLDAFSQAVAGACPVLAGPGSLEGLVLRGNHLACPVSTGGGGRRREDGIILGHCEGEVDGTEAKGGAGLDDIAGPGGAQEVVDQCALVWVEGDEAWQGGLEGLAVDADKGGLVEGLGMEMAEEVDCLGAGFDGSQGWLNRGQRGHHCLV